MITEVLRGKLERAERRIAFVATQTTGVMSSELAEALKEIRNIINALSPQESRSSKGSAVLFVDDEEIIRRIGTQILSREGYEVLTACDGIEALGVYEQNRDNIKCVILDLVMPRLDGMQTLRQLRRSAPDLGIILTTGYGEEEIRKRFGGLKLQGFLRKPFSANSLSKMVREAIGYTDGKG
ncbi:MAG: response regulator [Candidatus Sabulitectum sp.]|nr:response regulator [Candidatus Sabulitectum sp.]